MPKIPTKRYTDEIERWIVSNKSKGKRQKFAISTVSGKGATAKGEVFGKLLGVYGIGKWWTVTHLPTGFSLVGDHSFEKKRDAVRYVFGLFLLADWKFKKEDAPTDLGPLCKALRDFCRRAEVSADRLRIIVQRIRKVKRDV